MCALQAFLKRMCLGTFSRRGAVASATIYPAPSAHPRGAFLSYGNEVSYTIKKLPPGSFPSDGSFLSAPFSQQTEGIPFFHFVHRFYRFKAVLSGNYSPS